jgi:hypothetical protein
MPSNSDGVPLLGTYFNCIMVMIASSVVSTILVNLNLSSPNGTPKPVGPISDKIFLVWLPFLLRMKFEPETEIEKNAGKMGTKISPLNIEKQEFHHHFTNTALIRRRKQWMFAAAVVDRLCFIISILFVIISTIIFLFSNCT